VAYEKDRVFQGEPVSEREAWILANKGYRFEAGVEIDHLTALDLAELFWNPVQPHIHLQDYKDLRLLSRDQLLRKVFGIQELYPEITKADLFFYLTRGFLPYDTDVTRKLKRYRRFEKFLDITQDLFLLMYQDAIDYATSETRYPNIERVLELYDQLLGFDTTTSLIAKMFGIEVVGGLTPSDTLLFAKLYAYIKAFVTQTPAPKDDLNPISLEESVGMGSNEWETSEIYQKQKMPYETRTDTVMQTFYDYKDIEI
jgi:hypothetical protein